MKRTGALYIDHNDFDLHGKRTQNYDKRGSVYLLFVLSASSRTDIGSLANFV